MISKKPESRDPENLLPLPESVFHILLALADGERHGYGIMRETAVRSAGRVRLGPGTLYGSIKRTLAEGLIEECEARKDSDPGEDRRRYYRLTRFGQRVAAAEAGRLAALVRMARAKKLPAPRTA